MLGTLTVGMLIVGAFGISTPGMLMVGALEHQLLEYLLQFRSGHGHVLVWKILRLVEKRRGYLPLGAIAGIDGLKAAAIGRIDKVTLTTRKPRMKRT